jgi:hypothetical protein
MDDVSCLKDSWVGLFLDTDAGVRLIVFQHHVVSGTVLFDQVVFQQQRIFFRVYNDKF